MIRSKDNFLQVSDGAWIYFEDYGKENGDPIMILHGFMCSSKFFYKNIEALSQHHRLILVDWRGHGSSSKTLEHLTMDRCAKDIYELMEHLQLSDVTLLGWSMGSSVVMEYYEQFGNAHLKKIGVIDSMLYPFSDEEWNSHSLAGFNMDGMNAVLRKATTDYDRYARSLIPLYFHEQPDKETEDWVATELEKIPPYIAFALYNDFLFQDYTKTLTKIDIPLLLCCAKSGAIPRGIETGNYYKQLVGGNCYFHEFHDLGHVMFLEDPEQFNHTILDFVENYQRA
jgi:pimeloyl-ACP methyl ester carboxylesterase